MVTSPLPLPSRASTKLLVQVRINNTLDERLEIT